MREVVVLDRLDRLAADVGDELPEVHPQPLADRRHVADRVVGEEAVGVAQHVFFVPRAAERLVHGVPDDVVGVAPVDVELEAYCLRVEPARELGNLLQLDLQDSERRPWPGPVT